MSITRQVSRRAIVLQPTNAEVSTNQVYTPRYEFLVDGELSLPVPRIINSMKHQDAQANIYRCDVSVNKGGTSQYIVTVTSYNQVGGDPIVHVNQPVTIMTDRTRTTIPITTAVIGENRSLECTITESSPGMPATDMTVTLIMEDLGDLKTLRDGHIISDAANVVQPQKPELQFLQATVTEDVINNRTVVNTFGHVIQNGVGSNMPQRNALRIVGATVTDTPTATRIDTGFIGQMLESMLTESQMQSLYGTGWVLADGRNVVGSTYWSVTGASNIPDARGVFRRAKNNGRADGLQDPDGERALGSFQNDAIRNITGTFNIARATSGNVTGAFSGVSNNQISDGKGGENQGNITFNAARQVPTAADNRTKNIAVNVFIKIN